MNLTANPLWMYDFVLFVSAYLEKYQYAHFTISLDEFIHFSKNIVKRELAVVIWSFTLAN